MLNSVQLICGECPLAQCDEQSLWCIFRFLSDPNDKQRAIVSDLSMKPYTKKPDEEIKNVERREYFQARYRAKKLKAAIDAR